MEKEGTTGAGDTRECDPGYRIDTVSMENGRKNPEDSASRARMRSSLPLVNIGRYEEFKTASLMNIFCTVISPFWVYILRGLF